MLFIHTTRYKLYCCSVHMMFYTGIRYLAQDVTHYMLIHQISAHHLICIPPPSVPNIRCITHGSLSRNHAWYYIKFNRLKIPGPISNASILCYSYFNVTVIQTCFYRSVHPCGLPGMTILHACIQLTAKRTST